MRGISDLEVKYTLNYVELFAIINIGVGKWWMRWIYIFFYHPYWLVKGRIHLVLWSVIWVHHLPHSGLGPQWHNRRSLAWESRCSACRWCKASHNALLPFGTKSKRNIQMVTIFLKYQYTQQNQWKLNKIKKYKW